MRKGKKYAELGEELAETTPGLTTDSPSPLVPDAVASGAAAGASAAGEAATEAGGARAAGGRTAVIDRERLEPGAARTKPGKLADYVDQRSGLGKIVREFARKVFPDHWSFLLGEIALFSFIMLVLTGIFLTMFFVPSMTQVTYDGSFAPLHGQVMSEAYASTLNLSFEVRGGLLMRQIHHWAALLFIAAIVTHMFRVFFTGAFRKPRELNWLVGFGLMTLALVAGFSGYSLPDDVLSGNGLRIADGIAKSIPIVGSYISYLLFGGEFPGEALIPRLFTVHVLLVPGLILALVGLHLALLVINKHTQYPGAGRKDTNVVGQPLFPLYVAKAGGFAMIVFAVISLMGATMTINPVWNYGPYDPSPVSAGAQPDWYMLFMEGALRLMPGQAEFEAWGFTFSLNILIPAVLVPTLLMGFLALYPFFEAFVTGDKREHHVNDRPRNVPVRTGIGAAILSAFFILACAGSNDLIATHLHVSLNDVTWVLRFAVFIVPVLVFFLVKRICLGLQRRDREKVEHGYESGRIVRDADGGIYEIHDPVPAVETYKLAGFTAVAPTPIPSPTDANGVARPSARGDKVRAALQRFYFRDRVTPGLPHDAHADNAHADDAEALTVGEQAPALEGAGEGESGSSHDGGTPGR